MELILADITGTSGNDILNGTDGPDTIDGVIGTDSLYGKAGDDKFIFSGIQYSFPRPARGVIDGGSGFDEIDVSNLSGTSLGVNSLTVGSQDFDLISIERVILGPGDKFLYLSDASYEVITGSGNDRITVVGAGTVASGSGNDSFFVSGGSKPVFGRLNAGIGTDTLETNILADVDLEAGTAKIWEGQYAISGFENVLVYGYSTGTAVRGDSAANILSMQPGSYAGGLLDGRGGNDVLNGSKYSDTLYGGAGDDVLQGFAGADRIYSDAGNDVITASVDGDIIDGGSGHDTVNYNSLARGYVIARGDDSASIGVGEIRDIITGVEQINFQDATLTFDADSDAALVMRLYHSTFDREPDAQGLDHWLDQLAGGASESAVANAFLQSNEFANAAGTLSTGAFVDFLYNKVLDRPAEASGKTFWVNHIDGGLSRGDALLGFSESLEHRSQTSDILADGLWITNDDYQAIASLYDTFANRLPDEQGLGYWVGQLQSGASLRDIAAGFATSAEFQQSTSGLSNEQIVDFMYRNTLDREADASGRDYWVGLLDDGLSKGDLLLGFSESAEHYALIGSHIYSGVDYLMM